MRNPRSLLLVVFLVLLAGCLSGCASTGAKSPTGADQDFITDSYKVLYASATTADAAMTAMGTAYKAGQFSEANKLKAVAAMNQFKLSFDKAVDTLVIYSTIPGASTKLAAQTAMTTVGVQVAAIVALNIIQ